MANWNNSLSIVDFAQATGAEHAGLELTVPDRDGRIHLSILCGQVKVPLHVESVQDKLNTILTKEGDDAAKRWALDNIDIKENADGELCGFLRGGSLEVARTITLF